MPNTVTSINPTLAHVRTSPRARYDAGRSRRDSVPLEVHAEVDSVGRVDPLTILAKQDQDRVPELVPLRYGRMSITPFTFLRGAAAVMASDLAMGPRTDLWVELCGDAHLGNFRLYHAPDRRLVFDLNDFDETLPGPFEWDVKRLAVSVMVAARNNGFSTDKARVATSSAISSYQEFIAEASKLNPLDLYYYRFESEAVLKRLRHLGKKRRRRVEDFFVKATRKNSLRALRKYTDVVDGRRVIVPDPPLVVRVDERIDIENLEQVTSFYEEYLKTLPLERRAVLDQFSIVDIAKKVVGVGSVGTHCLIILLEAGDKTPLFLQLKQAVPSVLESYLGASVFEQAGQRVVEGQRLIQATSDVFLGWARWQGEDNDDLDFYFRQLWDGKGKIEIENLGPKSLASFAGLCGKTLAFAHARSGDAMMILGYIGDDRVFGDVMIEFAERYADRTKQDHAQLIEKIDHGEIKIVRDI